MTIGASLALGGGSPVDLDHALYLLALCPRSVTVSTIVDILDTRAPASVLMKVARSGSLSGSGAVYLLMVLSRDRHLPLVREELLRRYPCAELNLLAMGVMVS